MKDDTVARGAPPSLQLLYRGQDLQPLVQAALRVAGAGAAVFAPARQGDIWGWRECLPGDVPPAGLWDRLVNTDISPKSILLPQCEDVMRWSGQYKDLRVLPPGDWLPAVVLGVRPCDAAALDLLDEVLIGGQFVDETYRRRREQSLLITMACSKPGPACACDAFGLSPGHRSGDVVVYPGPDGLLLVANSARGTGVLEAFAAGQAGTGKDRQQAAAADRGSAARTAGSFESRPTPLGARFALGDLARSPEKLTSSLFASPVWGKLSGRCLSCGACTYVCPTCYCFAINDEPRGTSGRRVRTWDSCQFKDFLTMAGGHNPRPSKLERVRQRFMHKLNYHPQRYGKFLCVGCGRCVLACPVGLHIGEVAEALAQEAAKAAVPVGASEGGDA